MYSLALSLLLISPRHELRDSVAEELKGAPVKVEWQKDFDRALSDDKLKRFDVIILETDQVSEIGELKVLARSIPIILLHKNANHRVGLAAIREGASEYLTEDEMGSGTLFRVLRYCVERAKVEHALEASRTLVFRSQKMEAIGRTLAGVVHDFRHFLQVIYGNCSLMKRMSDQPVMDEMVEEIRLAGDKANNVIRNLINFAEGKRPGHMMVDVNRVILEMTPLFKALMKPGQLLEHHLTTFPLLARLDSRLEQVLMNLVVNAVDALAPNHGKVILETRYLHLDRSYTDGDMKLKPGSYVVIEVSDNGCGIRPEVKERIFEPFFTTKSREQGTGLGLAVVFSTLKDWRGELAVQSAIGVGTTFKLVLDCDLAPPELSPSLESIQRVTLHEKDSLLRLQLRRDLSALGCEVSELPEAGEGLLIYELDEAPHPYGVMISEFSPNLLRAIDKIDDRVKTLRTPFARHELQRALATTGELD